MKKTIKITAASPRLVLGDPAENAKRLAAAAKAAAENGTQLILFPKDCLSGSSLGSLKSSARLLRAAENALDDLCALTEELGAVIVAGFPMQTESGAESFSAVIYRGTSLCIKEGAVKGFAPFDFMVKSGSCQEGEYLPLTLIQDASPSLAGDGLAVSKALMELSKESGCIAYANSGSWESTTGGVYGGKCLIVNRGELLFQSESYVRGGSSAVALTEIDNSKEAVRLDRESSPKLFDRLDSCELEFSEKNPFLPADPAYIMPYCRDILRIQAVALAERMERAHIDKAVVGVSGGSDSTLALLASAAALQLLGKPSEDLIAVTMPGFGTTGRTKSNALSMMRELGAEIREIPIGPAVLQHFSDIGHDPEDRNASYENAQARERTQILMDICGDVNGLVVGTGDMSEAALGWCTYGGDHLAMYSVNCGLTKGLVKKTIETAALDMKCGEYMYPVAGDKEKLSEALLDVLDTPISPELLPPDESGEIAQVTEDKVGPYELHDYFLWNLAGLGKDPSDIYREAVRLFKDEYDGETVERWLNTFIRRFFTQQFKRNCSPEGPQITRMSLSPRGAWDMPSDVSFEAWKL